MEQEKKKSIRICNVTIYRILTYFIIYSIVGFLLETTFALVAFKKIESRQGFLYGPVCPIYGVGAVIMILALKKFNKDTITLFWGGVLVGSIVEYVISLFGEVVLNVRWWDYSNEFLNLNGRICLVYSLIWGIVGIFLVKFLNVKIDSAIEFFKSKINSTILKTIVVIITLLLAIDCVASVLAINSFLSKVVVEKNITNAQNRDVYIKTYEYFYENERRREFVDKYWSEKKIILIYPNLKLQLTNGHMLYVQDLYKEVKPYYYKFVKK